MKALRNDGLTLDENWPMITGVGCDADAVRDIAESEIACSVFMDRRVLADQAEDMVNVYLHGEDDPEVNASYLCEPQLINIDNYEILIDNGYYTEDEVKPEETSTPETPSTQVTDTQKTGDDTHMLLWILLAVAGMAGVVSAVWVARKKK